jgi:hypothetical protein
MNAGAFVKAYVVEVLKVLAAGLIALAALVGVLWSLGCTSFMSHTPVTQTVPLALAPDAAYTRATQAMGRMGGEVTHADRQTGLLQGKVHGVVLLTVQVSPAAEGSSVEVSGTVLPNKLAIGDMDEVAEYAKLLQ